MVTLTGLPDGLVLETKMDRPEVGKRHPDRSVRFERSKSGETDLEA